MGGLSPALFKNQVATFKTVRLQNVFLQRINKIEQVINIKLRQKWWTFRVSDAASHDSFFLFLHFCWFDYEASFNGGDLVCFFSSNEIEIEPDTNVVLSNSWSVNVSFGLETQTHKQTTDQLALVTKQKE